MYSCEWGVSDLLWQYIYIYIYIYYKTYYKTAKNALVGEIRIDATANGQNLNRPLTTKQQRIYIYIYICVCVCVCVILFASASVVRLKAYSSSFSIKR